MLLLVFLSLFLPNDANAYIPKLGTIITKTAENHGQGLYYIEQDVTFFLDPEPITVREEWIIENETKMRVTVTAKKDYKEKIQLTFIYDGNNRYFIDENGVKKTTRVGNDWFEPFFHYRYSKNFKQALITHQMAGSEILKDTKVNTTPTGTENYLSLSRAGGAINYLIKNSNLSETKSRAGIWIEQDQFLVRKIRLPTQVEIKASQYNQYSQRLFFPKNREITWNNIRVEANVVQIKSLPKSNDWLAKLNPKSLDFGKNPGLSRILPAEPALQEFYTRFR